MKTYQMGGHWGNAIQWQDIEKRRIVGWKNPKPSVGDFIESPMESGRDALFKIIKMEPCEDPKDMFFAFVEDAGYTEESSPNG